MEQLENKAIGEITKKQIDDDRLDQLLEWAANAVVEIALCEYNEKELKKI